MSKYQAARDFAFGNATIMANDDVEFAMREMRVCNAPNRFFSDYFAADAADDCVGSMGLRSAVINKLHAGEYV